MLATVPHDIPLREHSHLDLSSSADHFSLDDRLCPGCKKSAVNEQGGLVVAFGQSFFHVDCFKCAKCRNQVTADTNLLLLADGSPICANCSYNCNICRLPILDEAIMTGDDSYHAHCFKCKVCSNRIDDLVFAKTSQGIYCMNCHNERMAKIRKHAQKKAEREKANGGSGSSRSRENDARNFHREQQSRSGAPNPQPNTSSRWDNHHPPESVRSPPKPLTGPYVSDAFEAMPPSYSLSAAAKHQDTANSSSSIPLFRSRSPSVTVAPPENRPGKQLSNAYQSSEYPNQHPGLSKSNTLPIPPTLSFSQLKRSISYDDRPLDVLTQDSLLPASGSLHPDAISNNSLTSDGLSVTPRYDKRRSNNSGLPLSAFKDIPSSQSSNASSRSGSFHSQDQNGSPYLAAYDQPVSSKTQSRPPSRSSSTQSTHSSMVNHDSEHHWSGSRSRSIPANSYDQSHDDTIVMTSPPTMTVELEGSSAPAAASQRDNARFSPNPGGPRGQRSSATLSPIDMNGFHPQRRISSASSHSSDRQHSGNVSRSASPAYRADVPHSVESGTDTEPENETDRSSSDNHGLSPPVPPPKDTKHRNQGTRYPVVDANGDDNISGISQSGDLSDDMVESHSVERMSHTTFIAPALPPIRFSMNSADFSELLNSVGGLPSLKSLDNLAKLTRQSQEGVPSTPPPTASSISTLVQESITSREGPLSAELDQTSQTLSFSGAARTTSPEPVSSITVTGPRKTETDLVITKLREALSNAKQKGAQHLQVDINFVDTILELLETRNADYQQLKRRLDGMNRESKRFIDGMTVAQAEYDQELKARRDAEAEVTRLRVLLSGQAARLTALSGDNRRQEVRQQLSKELHDNISGLEHELSHLKVERDMTLAEVDELSAERSTSSPNDVAPTNLARSLTKRFESIRTQYQRELVPLTEQSETLTREVAELKAVRDVFLEETTVLNARNEELAQLSAVYARRIETAPEMSSKVVRDTSSRNSSDTPRPQQQPIMLAPSLSSSVSGSSTIYDESLDSRFMKVPKSENDLQTPAKPKFKWPGSSRAKDVVSPSSNMETSKSKAHIEHNFQQLSVLRFARCDHCGEKMWGSQLRCTVCATSIHVRCIANVQIPCSQSQQNNVREESQVPLPPSMFGRDLTEQVNADSKEEDRQVPVIVEKCIEAVEARGALDYEGIYRKTGGSGQSKAITQMFERGDYASFDLCDSDRFNDICSVTSVLKTYFRSLPVPLLTFDLHDQFMTAIAIRDPSLKQTSLIDLVNMLPNEHYFTLRMLMLHLNRVRERCEKNLMNGRNLGVVFGPTLLRSRDPAAEFSDMAGKALFVEWLVDNAPLVFQGSD